MDYSKAFKIPFKGLKIGRHDFKWEVGKEFFEPFEYTDIEECRLAVNLTLEIQERLFNLDFNIVGEVSVYCDRCLGKLLLPLNSGYRYIIKLGHEFKEESEDVLIIPENEYRIDIYQLVFDYIVLAVPLKKVHPEDAEGNPGCEPGILQILDKLSGNTMADPRWEPLSKVKLDKNN
ncbi:MAG: YceD family protein [Bacteroidales bacterium]